ncbi:MAG: thiamine pyrophosphate-dependent enzyme [Planctomycetota bacterium]|nr:thiamine pyrophosphate-dependent enzyme [Planctomycetota bacterium]
MMIEKAQSLGKGEISSTTNHPLEKYLQMERFPHIFCPGCGIGTTVNAFITAVSELERAGLIDYKELAVVTGGGCPSKIACYLRMDACYMPLGSVIPFAAGLKTANTKLKVVVISGETDLIGIGVNHFIHAARHNLDITVICLNSFLYEGIVSRTAASSSEIASSLTTPYGESGTFLNLPYLAVSSGAVYAARWTTVHVRRLKDSIKESMLKQGFRFIEAVTPCTTVFARYNRLGTSLDVMKYLLENSIVKENIAPLMADIGFNNGMIICGKFVDRTRPPSFDLYKKSAK